MSFISYDVVFEPAGRDACLAASLAAEKEEEDWIAGGPMMPAADIAVDECIGAS